MDTLKNLNGKTRNWGEILFFSMFIPWVAIVVLDATTLYYEYLYKIVVIWEIFLQFIPLLLVTAKVILFDKLDIIRKLLLLILLYAITAQCLNITFNNDLLLCVILIVGAYGIDFKKILKTYLLESVILTALTTCAAIAGLIPNIINHQYGRTRYALGSIWCTDYSAKVFFMLLICLYLYSRKMRWFHWIGLLAICSTVFAATFGKLDFICMILSIAVFFFHEMLQKRDGKLKDIWKTFLEKGAVFFTPCAAVLMTLLTLMYSSSNSIMDKLNHALSGRLDLGHRAFSDIGVTLFGQEVKWVGMGNHTNDMVPEGYNFVDCSYLNILFTFGIILALAAIAAHAFLAYKNRKDLRFVLVIAFISLNCIVAHHFTELAYNPFWAAMFAAMPAASEKAAVSPQKEESNA